MKPLTEKEYARLKAQVEEARAEADRAQGSLEQIMRQLQEEFSCSSLAEAKEKLADLEQEMRKEEEVFEATLSAYQAKWKKN
jgi:outer membrane protein TolC